LIEQKAKGKLNSKDGNGADREEPEENLRVDPDMFK
jgi:hypothetical protein